MIKAIGALALIAILFPNLGGAGDELNGIGLFAATASVGGVKKQRQKEA